jgi:hypothetical protein
MVKKLGQRGYDLLQMRAESYKKRDDVMDLFAAKELLKTLDQTVDNSFKKVRRLGS